MNLKNMTKKEMDNAIFDRRQQVADLEKMVYDDVSLTDKEISEKFDEIDALNHEIYKLRKESRRLFNEASGISIMDSKDVGNLAIYTAKVCI